MLVQLLRIFVQKNKKQFTQHFNYLLYTGGRLNLKISQSIIWTNQVKFLECNLERCHLKFFKGCISQMLVALDVFFIFMYFQFTFRVQGDSNIPEMDWFPRFTAINQISIKSFTQQKITCSKLSITAEKAYPELC